MFADGFAYLGIRTLEELMEYTLAEFNIMMTAVREKNKSDAELQFMIMKRSIIEAMNGKHKPLFGNQNALPKEENHKKFAEMVEKFKKGGGNFGTGKGKD